MRKRVGTPALTVVIILLIAALVYHVADLSWYNGHEEDVRTALWQHVKLCVVTMAIAIVIALPLGTLIARFSILYTPIIGLMGLIYTIPSLAFLAFLVTYIGIGFWNAIIALVAYAQFILVRNVVVGLRGVDHNVIDAARGMGMSPRQILLKVEYPLALPVILAGIRVATVATIAIATIATLIDAGGLGRLLFDGLNNGFFSTSEIQVGALAVSLLALAADLILRSVERLLPASRAQSAGRG
ncbi:MAG: ABC transporter permease [Chloroflexota bacterium]